MEELKRYAFVFMSFPGITFLYNKNDMSVKRCVKFIIWIVIYMEIHEYNDCSDIYCCCECFENRNVIESSGEAMDIISRIYRSRAGKIKVPTHTIHYGYIYDGEEAVDEVLVMVMRAPKAFTGEYRGD